MSSRASLTNQTAVTDFKRALLRENFFGNEMTADCARDCEETNEWITESDSVAANPLVTLRRHVAKSKLMKREKSTRVKIPSLRFWCTRAHYCCQFPSLNLKFIAFSSRNGLTVSIFFLSITRLYSAFIELFVQLSERNGVCEIVDFMSNPSCVVTKFWVEWKPSKAASIFRCHGSMAHMKTKKSD